MAKQTINLGSAPTGSGGDTPRSAFTKTQANFDEIYNALSSTVVKGNNITTSEMVIFSSGNPPNISACTVNTYSSLRIANGNNPYASAVIGLFRDGAGVGYFFGIDSADNQLKIGGGTMGAVARKIYHEGNTTRAADGTLKAV